MSRGLRFLFLAILLKVFPVQLYGQKITGTNPAYYEGDWISYCKSRFVSSIQVAPELVYVATEGGILRYNYRFGEWLFPFTASNGLPDNRILVAALDVATNLLWCSTPKAVSVYDRNAKLWQNLYLDELGIRPGDAVVSLGFSSKGVWLETRSGLLLFARLFDLNFVPVAEQSDSTIVWFGLRGFAPFSLDEYFPPLPLEFVRNGSGYALRDENMREFPFSYYLVDPWEELWVGTNGLGLFHANIQIRQLKPLPFGLLASDVKAIASNGDEFWFGGTETNSDRNGVTCWNAVSDSWQYYEPRYITRFRSEEIHSIALSRNSVWFGSGDGLVRFYRPKDLWYNFTSLDGLQDNLIHNLLVVDSLLYVATDDGLDELWFHPAFPDCIRIRPITPPKDKVAAYDVIRIGNELWVGTEYGLFWYDCTRKQGGYNREADGPGTEPVVALSILGDTLWAATPHRVEVLDLASGIWRGAPSRRIFDQTFIMDLEATNGVLWVGTTNGLFKHVPKKGYWRHFTQSDGLLHPVVQKLLLQGDYLWLGSPAGVTRFYWNSPFRID